MSGVWILIYFIGLLTSNIDGSPVNFPSLPTSVNVQESAIVGTWIHTVAPSGGNSPYVCFIELQDPDNATRSFGMFSMDVKTTLILDYETSTQYILTLQCEDNSTNPKSGLGTLTVNVQDVNEFAPVISGPLQVNISEETAVGDIVSGIFSASDGDVADILLYSLTGSDTGYFHVKAASGTMHVVSRLDRDAPGARTIFNDLLLTVTDTWGLSATASLTITITDINDMLPTFSPSVYYVTVTENKPAGQLLVTLTCSDGDESPGNGDITYSIISGDDSPGKFTLSGLNLQTTNTSLDYDVLSSQNYQYQLIITATDGGGTPNTGTATVFVQVVNMNDESPVWDTFNPPYTDPVTPYDVNEGVSAGSMVVTVSATDSDEGVEGLLTFSIVSIADDIGSNKPGVFRVDPVSGAVMTSMLLDADPPSGTLYYDVVVRASDHGTPSLSVERNIRVGIVDTNDNAPSFASMVQKISMLEDTNTSTSLLTLSASDRDINSTVMYSILSGNDAGKFQLSDNELQVSTVVDLDLPNLDPARFSLVITAVDGGSPELTGSTTVIITVITSNDHNPVFTEISSNYTFEENTAIGTSILILSATDDDFGQDGLISYSIILGDSGHFHLSSVSGDLKVVKLVDYESLSGGSLDLVVEASDGGGLTTTATVSLIVTDVNDNYPICLSTFVSLAMSEALFNGTDTYQMYSIVCSDPDVMDTLSYTIISGDTSGSFSVTSDGNLLLVQVLDYETETEHHLIIDVSDGAHSVEVEVLITVLPANEFWPFFSPATVSVSVSEDTPPDTTLLSFSVSDQDAGPDGQISYVLSTVSQGGSVLFEIEPTLGEVILMKSLDYESLPEEEKYYTIIIFISDGGGYQVPGTVSILVVDVNDHSPTCIQLFRQVTQAENSLPSDLPIILLSSLGCDDVDPGPGQELVYQLTQEPTGSQFEMVNDTLTLTSSLDFEDTQSFTLTIVVEDDWGSDSLSTSVIVEVSVTNENDGGPEFSEGLAVTVLESAVLGQTVCDVSATDPDYPNSPEGRLIYSITSGDPYGHFRMDPDTGTMTVLKQLDKETNMFYILYIEAVEEVGVYTASSQINVTIGGVNDNSPSCLQTIINLSINETASIGEVLYNLTCTDADGAALTYSITSGDTSVFTLSSIELQLLADLDYDTGSRHYDLTVTTSDGLLYTDMFFSIEILPVNEDTPVFTLGGIYTVSVSEDTELGVELIQVSASDTDARLDGTVTYFMTPHSKFFLDPLTGQIAVKDHLDFESNDVFTLDVTVSDLGSPTKTANASVEITVIDVNDNTPVFTPRFYKVMISENSSNEDIILMLSCVDTDSSSFGDVSFTLDSSGNTGNVFRVEKNTSSECLLIIDDTSTLDYDTKVHYDLMVWATDAGGLSSEAIVSVAITGQNESPPTFLPSASSTQTLSEDSPPSTLVLDLLAVDDDTGLDGQVRYRIDPGGGSKFKVDSVTGELYLSGYLDRESMSMYTLHIVAYDQGTIPSSLSSTYTLTVQVTDVNDQYPVCTDTGYTVYVSESCLPSSVVKEINCTDLDTDSPNNILSYSLIGGSGVNVFEIQNSTGVITLGSNSTLDRESLDNYTLTIQISDQGTPSYLTSVQMIVILTDENDNSPVFCCSPYSVNVSEDISMMTVVMQITATDLDLPPAGQVVYNLFSGSNKFTIDGLTGEIRTVSLLDREITPSYVLVVEATDLGSSPTTATATVSINLLDVNDNRPLCSSSVYHGVISETATPIQSLLFLSCTDVDEFTILSYTLLTPGMPFAVDPSSGEVYLSSTLTPGSESSYPMMIRVFDGIWSLNVTVVVSLIYSQSATTFLPTGPYSVNFKETQIKGVIVFQVNASDSNSTHLPTFTITAGDTDNAFSINPLSGVIQTRKTIDYESVTVYELEVTLSDVLSSGVQSVSTTLTVNIIDTNDTPPVCSPSQVSVSIPEDYIGSVLTLSCTDVDSLSTLNYTILSGNVNESFSVNSMTGEVVVCKELDFETITLYDLVIQVSDGIQPSLMFVSLTIQPVNEYAPVFSSTPYEVTVDETASIASSLFSVTASDLDSGSHGALLFYIVSGNTEQKFIIDSRSGTVSVRKRLDREQTSSYSLLIEAVDCLGPSPDSLSSEVTLTVAVNDSNDNFPIFTPLTYSVSVLETTASGSSLVTLTVTDDDMGVNSDITLTIVGGNDEGLFSINGNTLEISSGETLDAEIAPFHFVIIEAKDNGIVQRDALTRVSVTVLTVNEYTPTGPTNSVISIPENLVVGTVIYTVSANDSDVSEKGLLYSITSGNTPGSPFIMDSIHGNIQLWSALDYDTDPQNYTLVIEIEDEDGLTGALSSSFTLTVQLTDINDETPVFSLNNYVFTVAENVSGSTSLGTVSALDEEEGVNGEVSYSILSGDDFLFTIDTSTGVISTTSSATFDYENRTQHYLKVTASDQGVPSLSSTAIVFIRLTDINDNTPEFQLESFNVSVYEDAFIGVTVGSVRAVDLDSGDNGLVSYSLTPPGFFTVNPSTGLISTTTHLERELNETHVLYVVAIDDGDPPLSSTCTVTVVVLDKNDNVPVINGPYNVSVSEQTASGTLITRVEATDADIQENADFHFAIDSGNTNNTWNIELHSGIIQLAETLDREIVENYDLVVSVIDNGVPPRSTTATVYITILDVNDNTPVFTEAVYNFNVEENVPSGTFVGRIQAFDADTAENALLDYKLLYIEEGEPHFSIDSSTGDITTAENLDRETLDQYVFIYRATDNGSPQYYNDTQVNITILDLNDNSPLFTELSYNISVCENVSVGSEVFTFSIQDRDLLFTDAFLVDIDSGREDGSLAVQMFSVNATSFIISTKRRLDRETNSLYVFYLVATDLGSPPFSSSVLVNILVSDVNDNMPILSRLYESVEVDYQGKCVGIITTVTASDPDLFTSSVTFSFEENTPVFSIGETTGKVQMVSEAEKNAIYYLHVVAHDEGYFGQNSTVEPMILRIDTPDLSSMTISLYLSISQQYYQANKASFLAGLSDIYQSDYPTATVKPWCVEESNTETGSRRKLLSTGSTAIKLSVYIVEDNTTYSAENIGLKKKILPPVTALSYLVDDFDGSLLPALTGGIWTNFGVFQVEPFHVETATQQPIDALLIGLSIIGGMVFIIFVTFVAYLCVKPKQNTVKPEKPPEEPAPDLHVEHEYPLERTQRVQPAVGDVVRSHRGGLTPKSPVLKPKHDDIVCGPAPDQYLWEALLNADKRSEARKVRQRDSYRYHEPTVYPGTVDMKLDDDGKTKSFSWLSLSQGSKGTISSDIMKKRSDEMKETPPTNTAILKEQEQPMKEKKKEAQALAQGKKPTGPVLDLEDDRSIEEKTSTESQEFPQKQEKDEAVKSVYGAVDHGSETSVGDEGEESSGSGGFDQTAVDPETGNMYEYNSITKATRWLTAPDGGPVRASDFDQLGDSQETVDEKNETEIQDLDLEPYPDEEGSQMFDETGGEERSEGLYEEGSEEGSYSEDYDKTAVDPDTGYVYEYKMKTRWLTNEDGSPMTADQLQAGETGQDYDTENLDNPDYSEFEESPSPAPTFDKMAVDEKTGQMYEYNSATLETRWMKTRDGKPVISDQFKQTQPTTQTLTDQEDASLGSKQISKESAAAAHPPSIADSGHKTSTDRQNTPVRSHQTSREATVGEHPASAAELGKKHSTVRKSVTSVGVISQTSPSNKTLPDQKNTPTRSPQTSREGTPAELIKGSSPLRKSITSVGGISQTGPKSPSNKTSTDGGNTPVRSQQTSREGPLREYPPSVDQLIKKPSSVKKSFTSVGGISQTGQRSPSIQPSSVRKSVTSAGGISQTGQRSPSNKTSRDTEETPLRSNRTSRETTFGEHPTSAAKLIEKSSPLRKSITSVGGISQTGPKSPSNKTSTDGGNTPVRSQQTSREGPLGEYPPSVDQLIKKPSSVKKSFTSVGGISQTGQRSPSFQPSSVRKSVTSAGGISQTGQRSPSIQTSRDTEETPLRSNRTSRETTFGEHPTSAAKLMEKSSPLRKSITSVGGISQTGQKSPSNKPSSVKKSFTSVGGISQTGRRSPSIQPSSVRKSVTSTGGQTGQRSPSIQTSRDTEETPLRSNRTSRETTFGEHPTSAAKLMEKASTDRTVSPGRKIQTSRETTVGEHPASAAELTKQPSSVRKSVTSAGSISQTGQRSPSIQSSKSRRSSQSIGFINSHPQAEPSFPVGNDEREEPSYGHSEEPSFPMGNDEREEPSYGHSEEPSFPVGNDEREEPSYGHSEEPSSPVGNDEREEPSYGHSEEPSFPVGNDEREEPSYGHSEEPSFPVGNDEREEPSYGHSEEPSFPLGNDDSEEPSSPVGSEEPSYGHSEEPSSPVGNDDVEEKVPVLETPSPSSTEVDVMKPQTESYQVEKDDIKKDTSKQKSPESSQSSEASTEEVKKEDINKDAMKEKLSESSNVSGSSSEEETEAPSRGESSSSKSSLERAVRKRAPSDTDRSSVSSGSSTEETEVDRSSLSSVSESSGEKETEAEGSVSSSASESSEEKTGSRSSKSSVSGTESSSSEAERKDSPSSGSSGES